MACLELWRCAGACTACGAVEVGECVAGCACCVCSGWCHGRVAPAALLSAGIAACLCGEAFVFGFMLVCGLNRRPCCWFAWSALHPSVQEGKAPGSRVVCLRSLLEQKSWSYRSGLTKGKGSLFAIVDGAACTCCACVVLVWLHVLLQPLHSGFCSSRVCCFRAGSCRHPCRYGRRPAELKK